MFFQGNQAVSFSVSGGVALEPLCGPKEGCGDARWVEMGADRHLFVAYFLYFAMISGFLLIFTGVKHHFFFRVEFGIDGDLWRYLGI